MCVCVCVRVYTIQLPYPEYQGLPESKSTSRDSTRDGHGRTEISGGVLCKEME